MDCADQLVEEDFATWPATGWSSIGWHQATFGSATYAESTGFEFAQDTLLESVVFSTVGYTNVWLAFVQEYQFAGTGVWTGVYVDAPPDYYTIAQPTSSPQGLTVYAISAEAANKASVQVEFSIGCADTDQCFSTDRWRITDVLVCAWQGDVDPPGRVVRWRWIWVVRWRRIWVVRWRRICQRGRGFLRRFWYFHTARSCSARVDEKWCVPSFLDTK